MRQMILEMFAQMGISVRPTRYVPNGMLYCHTDRTYLHYDEIEPFAKLKSFSGIGISKDAKLYIRFI